MLLLAAALLAPRIDVQWEAPPGCPTAETFVRRVEEQTDVAADAPEAATLTAEVVIVERAPKHWELTLVLRGTSDAEERRVEGESCEAVVEAAVVVTSLRVVELASPPGVVPEPEVAPAPREEPRPPAAADRTPPEPRAEEAPAPAVVPATDDGRDPPSSSPPEIGGWLSAQGGLALGLLPGVGGAAGLEGGVEGSRWRVGLALHGAPARTGVHPQDGAVRGRFDAVTAEVLGCGVPTVGPVVFPLCARFAVGAIRGVGQGAVTEPAPGWSPWVGLGGSVGAAWRVTRWLAPFVAPEVLASLRGRSFSVGGRPGAVHETGPVAVRVWLGLEFHL